MNILLVNLSFLGDTILSTPVIAGLKKIYPESRISLLTTPVSSGLVINDPLVSEVITYDKRRRDKGFKGLVKQASLLREKKFDKVYSIHRSPRTSLLLFLAKIPERIGFKDAKLGFLYTEQRGKEFNGHAAIRNLSLLFQDMDKQKFNKELRLFAPDIKAASEKVREIPEKYIVMAPGSAWRTKQWHWQGYLSIAEHYIKKGIDIVLIGGQDDMDICRKIKTRARVTDLAGKITIQDTLHVMKNASLLVCNDSMPLHMASAFKIPTVAVFCATSPEFGFGPWQNENARVVEDSVLECKPCRRHGSNKCPAGTEKCMELDPEIVIQACGELI